MGDVREELASILKAHGVFLHRVELGDSETAEYVRASDFVRVVRSLAARGAVPEAEHTEQCCVCGKRFVVREVEMHDDGTNFQDIGEGAELADGRWVCSADHFEDAAGPAEQPARTGIPQPAGEAVPRNDLVPGVMRCAKCAFQLHRVTLYVRSGTTGAGDSATEPCPNGCGPLWPVTWRQWAEEAQGYAQRLQDELDALKAEPAPSAPEEGCGACGDACNGGPCRLAQESPATAPGDALSLHGAAGRSASRAPADVQEMAKPMTLDVAFDFADNPRPYHSLACPADTNSELYRALKVLAAETRRLSGAQQAAKDGA